MGEAVGQQAGRNRERGATRPQDTEGLQEAELGESTPKAPGNSHFTRLVAAKGLRAVLYRCRMEHSMKQSSLLRSAGERSDTTRFIGGRYSWLEHLAQGRCNTTRELSWRTTWSFSSSPPSFKSPLLPAGWGEAASCTRRVYFPLPRG